jgi:hypothetical protein
VKRCTRCGEEKLASEFSPNKRNRSGLASHCKPCAVQVTLASRSRNKARHQRYQREWRLRRYFKMTLKDYERMLADQGGGCAICGSPENLVVDHDHACCPTNRQSGDQACGKCNRGILCSPCNRILGFTGDDADRLREAASYLDRFSAQSLADQHEEFSP